MTDHTHTLLIGTYTDKLAHVDGHADGIMDSTLAESGVAAPRLRADVRNPSWLTTTADGRYVYAVIETTEFDGEPGGGAAAYARDTETGELTFLNALPSGGVEPAHIEVDPSERFVLVANYRTGSVSVFERNPEGSLGRLTDHVQHEGSSAHPIRQTGPHAHQIVFDPLNGDVFVPDLGQDAVLVYRLDAEGKLTARPDARITVAPGAGPRHLAFHSDLVHLFLLNELDSTLVVLRRENGRFVQTQVASTLPEGITEHNQTSAVRVSATGRSVLVSNRGYDSIAVFSLDPLDHLVELRTVEPTRGKEPRDFVQSPDGRALVVGNQDSDTIVTFDFDEETARLTFQAEVAAPTPVCLRFVS